MIADNGFATNGIAHELARVEEVSQAAPERHTMLRKVAKALSRRGLASAKTELANGALVALVDVLYEADGDGILANVDIDGRILIPLPWGPHGCAQWGVRVSEANALRRAMLKRSETHKPPLLCYDGVTRVWLLNVGDYGSKRVAMAYLRNLPITLAEWREAWAATRSKWAVQNLDNK